MKLIKNIDEFNACCCPVVTIGTFDGVHLGHKKVIEKLNQVATAVKGQSVVFTFWPHPRLVLDKQNESIKLLNTIDEKIALLEKLNIDFLVLFPFTKALSELTPEEFVKSVLVDRLKTGHLIFGYDHQFGKNREGDYSLLKQLSGKFGFTVEQLDEFIADDNKISSTTIRNKILSGEIDIAAKMLGYFYKISGRVVKGNEIGRKLGFPTANIFVEEQYKLIPPIGVYVAKVKVNKQFYNGMLSIGYNPTISTTNKTISVEINIFDFNQNIYDEKIEIHFIKKIREEIQFNSTQELQNQLMKDKENSLSILKNIDFEFD